MLYIASGAYEFSARAMASLKRHSCTPAMLGADGGDVNDWKHVELLVFGRHLIGGALDPSGVPPCTVVGPSEGSGRDCILAPAGVGLKGQIVDKGRLLASCHERLAAAGTPVTLTSSAALNAARCRRRAHKQLLCHANNATQTFTATGWHVTWASSGVEWSWTPG